MHAALKREAVEDLARFHGTDERIGVGNYAELIGFHQTLIRHAAGLEAAGGN